MLLLLLLYTTSFSNFFSHQRGWEHLWWSKAFSSDVLSQRSHWLRGSLLCRRWSWSLCQCHQPSDREVLRIYHLLLLGMCPPHLGPLTSPCQTSVLAFWPSSDELKRSWWFPISAPGKLLVLWTLTARWKRFNTKMQSILLGCLVYDFLDWLVELVNFIVIAPTCWYINTYDGDIERSCCQELIDIFHIVSAHAYIGHVARYFSIIGETLLRWGKRISSHWYFLCNQWYWIILIINFLISFRSNCQPDWNEANY